MSGCHCGDVFFFFVTCFSHTHTHTCGTSWRRGFEYKLSLPTIKRGSVHSPGARLCGLIVVLLIALTLCARICFADTSLVARTVFVDSSLQEMPKPKCCTCQSARDGTCRNCACVKGGRACTDCCLSRDGKCSNPNGCDPTVGKSGKLVCPFERCSAGKNGTPLERRWEDVSRFRSHLSSHLVDDNFVPSAQWLSDNSSQVCPDCSHAIVSLSSRCTKCRSEIPDSCFNVSIPKNRYLPKLQLNHVAQVSLGTTDAVLSSGK